MKSHTQRHTYVWALVAPLLKETSITKQHIPKKSPSFIVLIFLLLLIISGCASTLNGAPKSFLSPENGRLLDKNVAVKSLINVQTINDRNMKINEFLAEIDLQYIPFRLGLTQSDNHVNAFTDAVVLLSSLAGTLTESAGVKTNYLTLSALATGAHSIYDNRYLYTQSMFALIKGMDAARAQQVVEIRRKMSQEIQTYSGQTAFNDIIQYSYAGTLPGSLNWIQSNATKTETVNKDKLKSIPVPIQIDLDEEKKVRDAVSTELSKLDFAGLTAILNNLPAGISWDRNVLGSNDKKLAKKELTKVYRHLKLEDELPAQNIKQILSDAGMQL